MLQSFLITNGATGERSLIRIHAKTKKMFKLTVRGLRPVEELGQPYQFLADDYLARNAVSPALIDLDDEFSAFMNRDRLTLLDELRDHAASLPSDELAALVKAIVPPDAA